MRVCACVRVAHCAAGRSNNNRNRKLTKNASKRFCWRKSKLTTQKHFSRATYTHTHTHHSHRKTHMQTHSHTGTAFSGLCCWPSSHLSNICFLPHSFWPFFGSWLFLGFWFLASTFFASLGSLSLICILWFLENHWNWHTHTHIHWEGRERYREGEREIDISVIEMNYTLQSSQSLGLNKYNLLIGS